MSEPMDFRPKYDAKSYDWGKALNTLEGYTSPIAVSIEQIANEIRERQENAVLATISERMAVDIDKNELTKALAYDRDQYSKGFRNGYEKALADVRLQWIPISERLPEDLEPVNITWINHEPEPYYKEIKDKPFTATGVYFNGQWYWWSTLCTDTLAEYSHNFDDIIDKAIEIIAWQPLPEPYQKGGAENDT